MEETLLLLFHETLLYFIPEAPDHIGHGIFIQARYKLAILIIAQVVDGQMVAIFIQFPDQVKNSPVCFFSGTISLLIIGFNAVFKLYGSSLCKVEAGIF